MTTLEMVVFATMWFAVIFLAGLLLLLYRQVDRAYGTNAASVARVLPVGSEAPAIEILDGDRMVPLTLTGERPLLISFLEAGCPSCQELLPDLRVSESLRVIALISGDAHSGDFRVDCEAYSLAHPPDVIKSYGIGSFPTTYLIKNGRVAQASALRSAEDYREMASQAKSDTAAAKPLQSKS